MASAADAGVDESTAEHVADEISEGVAMVVDWLVVGVVHVLPVVASVRATLLLALLVAFFYMKDGALMWRWTVAAGRRVRPTSSIASANGSGQTISGYILGQAAIAAIDATLISLGALVLGVPHVGAIAMLTFLGAFVPYIGATIAGAFAVLLAVTDGGTARGVIMLVIVLAVQVFEGNVLQPWIQGRAVRLHPLVVALSVVAGGALAGFLGDLPRRAGRRVGVRRPRRAAQRRPARPRRRPRPDAQVSDLSGAPRRPGRRAPRRSSR